MVGRLSPPGVIERNAALRLLPRHSHDVTRPEALTPARTRMTAGWLEVIGERRVGDTVRWLIRSLPRGLCRRTRGGQGPEPSGPCRGTPPILRMAKRARRHPPRNFGVPSLRFGAAAVVRRLQEARRCKDRRLDCRYGRMEHHQPPQSFPKGGMGPRHRGRFEGRKHRRAAYRKGETCYRASTLETRSQKLRHEA